MTGQLDFLDENLVNDTEYINQWYFITIPNGSSLNSELQYAYSSEFYLNNAYTYIGNDSITNSSIGVVGNNNGVTANCTLDVKWNSVLYHYTESAVQKYDEWGTSNSPRHNLVDITPYYKKTFDCDNNNSALCMACWVQLSNKKIDINEYDSGVNEDNFNPTGKFSNSGWYPIGVNSGFSIIDALGGDDSVGYTDMNGNHSNKGKEKQSNFTMPIKQLYQMKVTLLFSKKE